MMSSSSIKNYHHEISLSLSLSTHTDTDTHTHKIPTAEENGRKQEESILGSYRPIPTPTHTHIQRPLTHRATTSFSFSFYLWVAPADVMLLYATLGFAQLIITHTHTEPLELIIYHGIYTQTHTGLVVSLITHIHNTLLSQHTHTHYGAKLLDLNCERRASRQHQIQLKTNQQRRGWCSGPNGKKK
jgi:hypothetical protein